MQGGMDIAGGAFSAANSAFSPAQGDKRYNQENRQQTAAVAGAVGTAFGMPWLGEATKIIDTASSGFTKEKDGSYKSGFAEAMDRNFNPTTAIGTFKDFAKTGNLNDLAAQYTFGLSKGETTAEKRLKQEKLNQEDILNKESRMKSAALYGGIKKMGNSLYDEGGKIQKPELSAEPAPRDEKATILDGKTHEEGGNAIVDGQTGEKVAETEREELLLNAEQTKVLEQLSSRIKPDAGPESFLSLGKYIQQILMNTTEDLSGKYGTVSN